MTHRILPRAFTFRRDLAVSEEVLKELVCVLIGLAGIFRDSHIVAFLRKVSVVRDTPVFTHRRVPLAAIWAQPGMMEPYLIL